MLCLLQGKPAHSNGPVVEVTQTRVLGLPAAVVSVEVSSRPRRARKALEEALRRLMELKPRRVVYERGFPYMKPCAAAGFVPAGADLHRFLAPQAAAAACPEGGAVYFYAARPDRVVREHISRMRHRFRHILAETGGGRRFTDDLLFEFGLSVIQNPSPERLRDASAALFYAKPDRPVVLSPQCVVLAPRRAWLEKIESGAFVAGLEVGLKTGKWPPLPEGFPPEPLIGAALEAETLRPEEVAVLRVRLCRRDFPGEEPAGRVLTNTGSVSII